MGRWLIGRLAWCGVMLVGIALVTFVIAEGIGDPARMRAGPHADAATVAVIRRELGLDRPLLVRFGAFLARAVRGDLGHSLQTDEPVTGILRERLPATALLAVAGMALWLLIGIPAGIATAMSRRADRVSLVLGIGLLSIPTFLLGRWGQYLLAYRTGWFPVAGYGSVGHLLLPALTLGLAGAGYYARLVHTSMTEVLREDYVRAARARGLPPGWVLRRYALRNALLPLITVVGMDLPGLLSGVVFIEYIFAWPGIGGRAVKAVFDLDVPVIVGTVLFSATLVVVANLVVDLTYRFVDPRIGGSETR